MPILRKIEVFLRDTGMAPTRFGRDACDAPIITGGMASRDIEEQQRAIMG